jgi:hypothetical protein
LYHLEDEKQREYQRVREEGYVQQVQDYLDTALPSPELAE